MTDVQIISVKLSDWIYQNVFNTKSQNENLRPEKTMLWLDWKEKNLTVINPSIHFSWMVMRKLETWCFLIVILIYFLIPSFKTFKTSNPQKKNHNKTQYWYSTELCYVQKFKHFWRIVILSIPACISQNQLDPLVTINILISWLAYIEVRYIIGIVFFISHLGCHNKER